MLMGERTLSPVPAKLFCAVQFKPTLPNPPVPYPVPMCALAWESYLV